jgi:hypothetical protein
MPHVRFPNGGEADLVSLEGDRIRLRSTVASAPGTPLSGNLDTGSLLRVKVHRCRRQDDRFVIEGRLVDATRKLREELAALLGAAMPGVPNR